MPLITTIYVLDKVDPKEVFDFCNSLMGAEHPAFTKTHDEWDPAGIVSLDNAPSQGLPAWLMSNYRENRPLNRVDIYEDSENPTMITSPACWMELSFDTGYAYRDTFGGCTELHARYIVSLHGWLNERNVAMAWKNRFSGMIHSGIQGLEEFFEGGDRATEWFNNSVIPVVQNLKPDL